MRREIMHMFKHLDDCELIQQRAGRFSPVRRAEYNIAIQPRDFTAIFRQGLQCQIQQPLFLP